MSSIKTPVSAKAHEADATEVKYSECPVSGERILPSQEEHYKTYPRYSCSKCIKGVGHDGYPDSVPWVGYMKAERLCYRCASWRYEDNEGRNDNRAGRKIIVNGQMLLIAPDTSKSVMFNPLCGESFTFELLPTAQSQESPAGEASIPGERITSKNVWPLDRVPEGFKERFPDTAKVIRK